ncbi:MULTISPECIES: caspase family protein [unclassified Bradyrhizobium]|uniref:caspase family protein n=1 Tax=unclassified Bradyrhizobium TaxID=2631580 RepID=UPI001BA61AAA|nr:MULTISPECIES: caspase family protein [unclassified Bradyrhizobium]MBR1205022.1 caspase family protein [Bradyrhizobium sp. AUGA SZCCT0124]MBR1312108.1 caspase family protein [Bradyrhizobium sp. AUGA SZCCT0051]MBR1343838.1 caspase family protein [Bradyrhizobium sp. AUGA SZCCT0105]MBR1358379.1 caspase family protein [Bradyrhizobium sp. AUGA SZCCT0045]
MNGSGPLKLKRLLLAVAALLLIACRPAFAEKRVALVLGNSAYRNTAPLANPVNDASVMAATLKNAGFDVVDFRRDLPAIETRRALREFADLARDADIALVYYAGHGIEVDGANYLIPVDARLERDTDVYDEAFSLDRILVAIEPARRLRLVILDACRDNPFAKTMKRTLATRAIGQGLAKVEPTSPNVLIAYSAKAGSTAADGDGKNSPFTIALSKFLPTPGLDVRRAFGYVRDEVLKTTNNRQEPFVYGSLGGEDVPLVPAPAKPAPAAAAAAAAPVAPAPTPQSEARRDYELALQIGNKSAMNAFLAQYPSGYYANLARLQLEKFTAEDARVAATEKARLAEQERARLAAEGAQKAQQARAEADAKAAEVARLAAERAKQVAQDQAAAAEQKRQADTALSDRAATNKAVPDQAATQAAAAPPAPPEKTTTVAALATGSPEVDVVKSVQAELRRVGCLTGTVDGDWNAASQRSLTLFNRYAGTKLDIKTASVDTLDAVKLKQSRVCPLVCEHGYKADGDRCSRIVCAEGSFLNDDNECEKRRERKPVAKRDSDERLPRRDRERAFRPQREPQVPSADIPRPQGRARAEGGGSGQIMCDAYLCRPVRRGCHLEYRGGGGPGGNVGNVEVCN